MYIHFTFKNGSNPYIATKSNKLFNIICNYNIQQLDDISFKVLSERENSPKTYQDKKEILRNFAIDWQLFFNEISYSWSQLESLQNFFEEYGKKYGLLTEFKENAII